MSTYAKEEATIFNCCRNDEKRKLEKTMPFNNNARHKQHESSNR